MPYAKQHANPASSPQAKRDDYIEHTSTEQNLLVSAYRELNAVRLVEYVENIENLEALENIETSKQAANRKLSNKPATSIRTSSKQTA